MLIVTALGGNALLRRGQPMTSQNQRENVRIAAQALAPIAAPLFRVRYAILNSLVPIQLPFEFVLLPLSRCFYI